MLEFQFSIQLFEYFIAQMNVIKRISASFAANEIRNGWL